MAQVKAFGERIADALIEDGLLTANQAEELLARQKKEGTRLLKLILEQACVSDQDMAVSMGRVLNTPPVNPWGGCRNDPLHATLASHASWALDNSRAEFYSTVANLFGFTFGGSDGFTTNVEHDYNSTSSSPTTYICGPKNGLPPIDAPVLYNTP